MLPIIPSSEATRGLSHILSGRGRLDGGDELGEAGVGGVLDDPQLGTADVLVQDDHVARGALIVAPADQQGRHLDLA
jgi:hypothetical protein